MNVDWFKNGHNYEALCTVSWWLLGADVCDERIVQFIGGKLRIKPNTYV